jgi:transglutaminase-like putative cysteine protease
MQSDHPRITSLASTIVAGETRVDRAATKIKNWVYTNVRKEPTISLPSALEVLDSRRGDCNEHAVLFGALARAAGIPARTVVGLTYLKNAFYYHAWSEVWMDDWISIDSTLDQFPADVTHIRLIEGEIDRQMDILKLLGRIRIGVIEP